MKLFEDASTNLIPFQGEVYYYPNFFTADYFDVLKRKIEWNQEAIWMFGKRVMQPRLTALYGNQEISYGYSGIIMKPKPWIDFLVEIKNRIEATAGQDFTHVLLNYYRDGQDSMGWHRDNEASLGPNPTIASVTFGVPRTFQLRNYKDKKIKTSLVLESRSLLLMKGETQHFWEHQLPKSAKVKGERINLTFRKVIA